MPFAARIVTADDQPLLGVDPMRLTRDLGFVAMVGIIDPLRAEAHDAVRTALQAGIQVRMITGDHAVTAAAKHLLDLGHRRIGVISPPAGFSITRERLAAFRRAFAELGQPLDEDLVVQGDFDIEAGAKGARALMQKRQNGPMTGL